MAKAGWFRDHLDRHDYRWHDGEAWTAHVATADRFETDPIGSGDPSPDPLDESVWLPPPYMITGKRLGPMAASRPSYGFEATPEGGYEPITTGNRLLDFNQNYINEFESRMRRESSLLESSISALKELPLLSSLAWLLVVVSLAATAGVMVVAFSIGRRIWMGPAGPIWLFILVLATVFVLHVVVSTINVLAFTSAVARATPRVASTGEVGRGLAMATGGTFRLLAARLGAAIPYGGFFRLLYEAGAVFAIPVSIAEGVGYREAQALSEELVRLRWGPGRFRAVGLPRMSPWTYLYTRSRLRYGFAGPFLAMLPLIVLFFAPVVIAFTTSSPSVILGAFAVAYGGLLLLYIAWVSSFAPLLQGVLRTYLYRYAATGQALPPYEAPALHACLREEIRASVGLPQRASDGESRHNAEPGLPGAWKAALADGIPYLEHESGIPPATLSDIVRDGLQLGRDSKAVLRALRGSGDGGSEAERIIEATGIERERCRNAVVNLIMLGKVRLVAVTDGRPRYVAVR